MTSITDSRLTGSSVLVPLETATAAGIASLTEGLAEISKTAIFSAQAVALDRARPRLEAARKAVRFVTRRATCPRDAAEELAEERLNAITHGLGLALSMAGVVYLLTSVAAAGSGLRVASCAVYGASLMAMYLASTLLHAARAPRLKLRFQLFDHVAIYLLIAGTYTPLAAMMQGYAGFTLLACVWLLAAIGISIKVKNADRLKETSPLPCVGLGWLALVALKPLLAALPGGAVVLLMAGGVSFSAGVVFYCRDDQRYFHAVWHLFVMAGTALHFGAILVALAG